MKFPFAQLLRFLGFSPRDPEKPLPIVLPPQPDVQVEPLEPTHREGRSSFRFPGFAVKKEKWRRRRQRDARQRNYPAWKRQRISLNHQQQTINFSNG